MCLLKQCCPFLKQLLKNWLFKCYFKNLRFVLFLICTFFKGHFTLCKSKIKACFVTAPAHTVSPNLVHIFSTSESSGHTVHGKQSLVALVTSEKVPLSQDLHREFCSVVHATVTPYLGDKCYTGCMIHQLYDNNSSYTRTRYHE